MKIDIFSSAGEKKSTLELPAVLFGQPVKHGLIHQAIMLQQNNRRMPIAHAKNRHEVAGSTRKLYDQKHTGRARRGSVRSPLLRGGGKAFGPRSDQNYRKDMPKSMRKAALICCLSLQAKKATIVGLESYPNTIKTKDVVGLIGKMKLADARHILFVLPEQHQSLWLSTRNLKSVKTITVSYLNPEDLIHARAIVFIGDSIAKAEEMLAGKKNMRVQKSKMVLDGVVKEEMPVAKRSKTAKKADAPTKAAKVSKKAAPKVSKKKTSDSSDSSK
jgi:large subunit ribosomal protein L4